MSKEHFFNEREKAQNSVVAKFLSLDGGRSLIVDSPTGSGKTHIAIKAAMEMRKKTGRAVIVSTNTNHNAKVMYAKAKGGDFLLDNVCMDIGKRNYVDFDALLESMDTDMPFARNVTKKEIIEKYELKHDEGESIGMSRNTLIDDFMAENNLSEKDVSISSLAQAEYRSIETKSIREIIENIKNNQIIITNHAYLLLIYTYLGQEKTPVTIEEKQALFDCPIIMDEVHALFDAAQSIFSTRFSLFRLLYSLKGVKSETVGHLTGVMKEDIDKSISFVDKQLESLLSYQTKEGGQDIYNQAQNVLVELKNFFDNKRTTSMSARLGKIKNPTDELRRHIHNTTTELRELRSIPLKKPSISFSPNNFPVYEVGSKVPSYNIKKSLWLRLKAPFLGMSGTLRHKTGTTKESFLWAMERIGFLSQSKEDFQTFLSENEEMNESQKELYYERYDAYEERLSSTQYHVSPQLFERGRYQYCVVDEDIYTRPYQKDFEEKGENWISSLANFIAGVMTHNSLVLISSYRDAEKIATIIAEQRKDVEVLRAREDEPMSATVGKYKALKSPKCLVGTMQYFTGLDLKGDQLSELFIAKAPFKTPKNNTGAKKYKGMSFTLTESYENQTMMQFLQGFGRPIRDYEDTAITYILDTRIFSKKRPYYKRFMDEKSIQVSFAEAICAKGDLLGMKTAGSESLYAFFHPYFAGRAFDDLSGTLGICGSGEKEKEVFCRISRKMLKEGYTVDRLIGKESFDLMLASEKYDFVLLLFEAYRQMQIKKRLPDPISVAVGTEGFKEDPCSILLGFLANN